MTFCDVRNESGPAADELTIQIAGIAAQVVPVLESVTDLTVGPAVPVIRVVTPDTWVELHMAHVQRVVQHNTDELNLGWLKAKIFRYALRVKSRHLQVIWPIVMGATVEAEDGTPHVLLVPEALEHCGFEKPELMKTIAHELAHVLQHLTGDGAAFAAGMSMRSQRGPNGLAVKHFLEGHARWADLLVTTRLLGREVDEQSGRESETYWRTRAQAEKRGGGPPREVYRQGAKWVGAVVDQVGTDPLNRAWKDPSLIPTHAEILAPESWIARVAI